jgi:phage regulator Rha-like protein
VAESKGVARMTDDHDNILRLIDMIANRIDPLTIDAGLLHALVELESLIIAEARR